MDIGSKYKVIYKVWDKKQECWGEVIEDFVTRKQFKDMSKIMGESMLLVDIIKLT